MFERLLTHEGHTRRVVVEHLPAGGWDVREELDDREWSRAHYGDWRRVELALQVRLCLLARDGWNLRPTA